MTNDSPTPPPAEPNGQPPYGGTPAGYPAQQPYPPAPPAYAGAQAGYPGQQHGAYGGYGAPATDPGKNLGIAGLIVSIAGLLVWVIAPIVGIILSIVGLVKSKSAGFRNLPAVWGIIVGAVLLVLTIVAVALIIWFTVSIASDITTQIMEQCASSDDGYIELYGEEVSCAELGY